MKKNVEIRKAERQDVPLLLEFIRGIAKYGKMENEVVASPNVLEQGFPIVLFSFPCHPRTIDGRWF